MSHKPVFAPVSRCTPLAASIGAVLLVAAGSATAANGATSPAPFAGAKLAQAATAAHLPVLFGKSGRAVSSKSAAKPSVTAALQVASCGDDPDDFTTLRHAVLTANPGDVISLAGIQCGAIALQHGAIAVTVDDLTINGPGAAALTIDGNGSDRVFMHTGVGTLALSKVTVANGARVADKAYGGCIYTKGNLALSEATLTSCRALGQSGAVGGGAVAFGTITVEHSVVSGNVADAAIGAGKGQTSALGGGLVSVSQTGTTVLQHSLVTGNVVHSPSGIAEGGGAVAFQLSVKYSTFTDNHAIGFGDQDYYSAAGALTSLYSLFMIGSTIDHNSADVAGAMFLSNNGFATIVQSTISSNLGNLAVGGIASNVNTSIANSTIAFNSGGALGGGGLVLSSANTATLQSTIIADNVPDDVYGGLGISGNNNLIKVAGANVILPAGTITLDPELGPLASNGGVLRTHALLPGSPALNAGSNPADLASDERGAGFQRSVGPGVDIGAYEADPDRIFSDPFDGL